MGMDAAENTDVSNLTSEGSVKAANGAGESLDFEALFNDQKEANERVTKEFDSLKSEHAKTSDTVGKLRTALVGESKEADPVATELERLDQEEQELIEAAMSAQQAGKPITLTVKNGLRTIKAYREMLTDRKSTSTKLDELEKKVKEAADPAQQQLQSMYSNLDTFIERNLDTIYGAGEDFQDVKQAQFTAITKLIGKELNYRAENDPTTFNRLLKDKEAQSKLVAHFVEKNMPPKARQILKENQIRTTPLPVDQMMEAWRDLKAQGKHNTPEALSLREDIASRVVGDKAFKGTQQRR